MREIDRCPTTGEDFNLLWDALLGEFGAAWIDLGRLVRPEDGPCRRWSTKT
jgi:hypothetical protein